MNLMQIEFVDAYGANDQPQSMQFRLAVGFSVHLLINSLC